MKLSSENLFIKILEPEDVTAEMLPWFENDELMRYYTNSKAKITLESLKSSIIEGKQNNNVFTYGVFHKESSKLIGTLKLGPVNWVHRISDLVILIGDTNFHGKGLAVEAIKLGNQMAFESHDLRKLFGGMYESNHSSIKAYTRAGWQIEGKLKGHYLVDGIAQDRILVGCFNPKYFPDNQL